MTKTLLGWKSCKYILQWVRSFGTRDLRQDHSGPKNGRIGMPPYYGEPSLQFWNSQQKSQPSAIYQCSSVSGSVEHGVYIVFFDMQWVPLAKSARVKIIRNSRAAKSARMSLYNGEPPLQFWNSQQKSQPSAIYQRCSVSGSVEYIYIYI